MAAIGESGEGVLIAAFFQVDDLLRGAALVVGEEELAAEGRWRDTQLRLGCV
jgi:hypothetical protein